LTCFLTVSLESRSRARTIPDLARLQAETRRLDVESQFEQRAAAIVHDTVLGDLAAVMHSNGVVDDRMRARFRADIATLADPSWLSDSATFERHVPVDSELRLAISTLATEFQWRGLSVNTSGNYDGVVGVSREAAAALVFAIRACLENIVQHAQCDSADLVFDSSPDHVTAMVVDSGVGFDPQHVSPDRLGIRGSIVGRIEQHGGTVKVWSSPGSGTSVVIYLPAAPKPEGTND
jgi:glucose-6-phosphate-specific signal transduction histidine kinase